MSDANKRGSVDFFAGVYHDLLREYQRVISDTRFKQVINKQIEIFDSTVISLFQEILKRVGRTPANGKRKGAGFVTRVKDNAVYKLEEELYIDECIHSGVLEDAIIEVTVKEEDGRSNCFTSS